MRYIFIVTGMILLFSSCSLFKSSDEIKALTLKVDSLSAKVAELSLQNKALDEEFTWMENELVRLSTENKSKAVAAVPVPAAKVAEKETKDWQCKAITNSGKRCSRPALDGSKYCWQHKKTYEPEKTETNDTPAGSVPVNPVQK
jgi:hypothetical protein